MTATRRRTTDVLLFICLASQNLMAASQPRETLTNASDVLALTAKEASSAVPISVKGIVTRQRRTGTASFLSRIPAAASSSGIKPTVHPSQATLWRSPE